MKNEPSAPISVDVINGKLNGTGIKSCSVGMNPKRSDLVVLRPKGRTMKTKD
jgi:hypothetical protein